LAGDVDGAEHDRLCCGRDHGQTERERDDDPERSPFGRLIVVVLLCGWT
jgi:hypothetical protein